MNTTLIIVELEELAWTSRGDSNDLIAIANFNAALQFLTSELGYTVIAVSSLDNHRVNELVDKFELREFFRNRVFGSTADRVSYPDAGLWEEVILPQFSEEQLASFERHIVLGQTKDSADLAIASGSRLIAFVKEKATVEYPLEPVFEIERWDSFRGHFAARCFHPK